VQCGHATLAAAAAIFFGERNPAQRLQFDTLSGELVVTRQSAAGGAGQETDLLSMDLPAIEASSTAVPPGMEAVVKVRWACLLCMLVLQSLCWQGCPRWSER
jgi:predicted PhzF superfamily epimerase YddE/YHI9